MIGSSRRNAVAVSVGWWYLRRLIRKRGSAAVAGLVAGEGLSFARRPRKLRSLRLMLASALIGAGAVFWWRRRQGGGDDWGDWEPAPSPGPEPARSAPIPDKAPEPSAPVPDPVAT